MRVCTCTRDGMNENIAVTLERYMYDMFWYAVQLLFSWFTIDKKEQPVQTKHGKGDSQLVLMKIEKLLKFIELL